MSAGLSATKHPLAAEWREEWSRELAKPPGADAEIACAVVIVFRLGAEHFALPASSVVEVTRVPPIHRIPSRDAAAVGIVNVRGRIAVCASLIPLLSPQGGGIAAEPRLVVFQADEWIFATHVDGVEGVQRLDLHDLAPPPPPEDSNRFTTGLWTIAGRSVARLDAHRLFAALKESLA